jgi:hypothetical protein
MNDAEIHGDSRVVDAAISQLPVGAEAADPLAWEMIEPGRYMPRRVRGSYRGRVLG